MIRLAILLLLTIPCAALAEDATKPVDWMLYRDDRGILRLLTADFRHDVWENDWEGVRSVQFAVNVTRRYTRIDASEYFTSASTRYLRLFQRPDGTVLCKCWNALDPYTVGSVEFPNFRAVLADPDVSRMLWPILSHFGQSIPTASEMRQRIRGGRCDKSTRDRVRAILPDLDSVDPTVRRRARRRLEPYRDVLLDGVGQLCLSTGQRAQVAAIAHLPPVPGSVELWEVAVAVFGDDR